MSFTIDSLEQSGQQFAARLEDQPNTQEDMERIISYGYLILGLTSQQRGYHTTLPSLVKDIERDGLTTERSILSQDVVEAAHDSVERFSDASKNSWTTLGYDNNLRRKNGHIHVTLDKRQAERPNSYGFPEIAYVALNTLVKSTQIKNSPNALTEQESRERLELVNDEISRLLAGGETTKSVVVIKPEQPALLRTMLDYLGEGSALDGHLRTNPEMIDFETGRLYRYETMTDTRLPGPIQPQFIETIYDRPGGNYREVILRGDGQNLF